MIPISEINNKAKVEIYKDMHSIIDELKGVSSGSRFGQLAKELNSLYDLADKHKLTGYPEYEKYISRDINEQVRNSLCYELFMKDMEKHYLAVCKDLPYHYDFADQADIFDDYHFKKDYRPLSRIKDFEETLYYAEEIMSYHDPKMLDRFNDIKNKNHILINYTSEEYADGAYLLTFYDNKKPYISFSLNGTIGDVGKIIHEAGHLLQYDLIKNSQGNNIYLFREVASHYKELVCYDLLKDNKAFETDMDICLNNYLDELNIHLIELYFNLENIYNTDYSLYKNLIYSYGMIIALKYYDIYKQDPERAKYLTNRFIHESYNLDFLTVLDSFGLNKEEIKNGKIIKKYLKK